jgi:hypothetical protein
VIGEVPDEVKESSKRESNEELVSPFKEYRRFSLYPKIIDKGLQLEDAVYIAQLAAELGFDKGLNLNNCWPRQEVVVVV